MKTNLKPNLRRTLFWDVDYDKIKWNKNYQFIIERVLERGTFDEWKEIKRYYGIEKIKEAALQARWLDQTTLSFCSAYFKTPVNQFRCYTLRLSNPAPWVF
ncbi:hypothetical protein GCM10028803_09540 [Larkinella knui]|uniref:DUF6922 domain-containing protein n=1 Tax=Larkinella knui TaxID=2025310 RepID=A0A3P1CCV5_9BACT|nr:hypothetical protein [Larkinella knui]RRB11068.1 hypothetical protein EHT87_28430 [Larkinella knui]